MQLCDFQNLFKRFLNEFNEGASTTKLGRLFQVLVILSRYVTADATTAVCLSTMPLYRDCRHKSAIGRFVCYLQRKCRCTGPFGPICSFDTVDHEILLRRLELFGIGGCNIRWFKSYLVGRRQFVCISSSSSSPTVCTSSSSSPTVIVPCVPQGSVLGSILFLCTLLNCRLWYRTVGWTLITMLMTFRFTVSVHWRRLRAWNYSTVFQNALTVSPAGCGQVGSSWTPAR